MTAGETGRVLRRLAGFTGLPFLSLLTPFLLLPILARHASAEQWSSLALGQSVGTVAAITVAYGWTLKGPAVVASASNQEKRHIYKESLLARGALALVITPLAMVSSKFLASGNADALAVTAAGAFAANGLSGNWFAIGVGQPRLIAVYDLLPKALATAASSAIILLGFRLETYPALMALASISGVVAISRAILRGPRVPSGRPQRLVNLLRSNASAAATEVAGGAYSAGSVALVTSQASVAQSAVFASADRLYRLALYSVVALSQALQAWVAESTGRERSRRFGLSLASHTALGIVGLASLSLFGPSFSTLLFGPNLAIDFPTGLALGAAFLGVSLNTSTGRHLLIPTGRTKTVMISTFTGSAIGIPATLLGAFAYGAQGGAWGLALSQAVVLTVQVPDTVKQVRRLRQSK